MKHTGRKLYHMLGGLGLLSLYHILGRGHALVVYTVLLMLVLALDVTRLRVAALNRFIFSRFPGFIRQNEAAKLTGTAPYILGIALCCYMFRSDIASAAVCFLACGDVAATTIGERFGRTKIGDKSLEGTTAFAIAAAAAGLLLPLAGIPVSPGIILAGAVAAAGIEILPLPVNDNLAIPLLSGGVMTLISRLAG